MNEEQQRFVTEFLRYGDKIIAYKTAYDNPSSDPDVIISAANRLLRNPEVKAVIEAAQNRIRSEVEAEVKAELKQELLTVQRKRELLAQIATGEALIEQHTKGKNCNMCTILQRPNFTHILKAIDLDSRLAGHYKTNGHSTVRPVQQTEKVEKQNKKEQTAALEDGVEVVDPERTGIFYSEIEEELYQNEEQQKENTEPVIIQEQQIKTLLTFGEHDQPQKLKKLNLLE